MKYIKQLDAIRALAVMMVIASHWIPKVNVWKIGEMGVDIFFVLSGFLISGILFDSKMELEITGGSSFNLIKNFIIRRALRIFPLYYLIIFIHYLLNDLAGNTIRDSLLYHLTYTSNFYFVLNPRFNSLFTHLWSLSVEEQFYLIWPWFILLVKKEKLNTMIWLSFLAATLFSFTVPGRIDKLMPACIGSFALGAWLAYGWVNKISLTNRQKYILNVLSVISLIVLALYPIIPRVLNPYSLTRIFISILTVRVIVYCLYENDFKVANRILQNSSLLFIGKISYGIYLIHTLCPWLWRSIVSELRSFGFDFYGLFPMLPESSLRVIDLGMQFGLVVLLAWLSWICFEKPIIQLKKYFEYTKQRI